MDQLVAKASTDTGQHNLQTQETNVHAPTGIRTRDPSNQAAKTYALDGAATGIGQYCIISLTKSVSEIFSSEFA
jgi:hypothetical protein